MCKQTAKRGFLDLRLDKFTDLDVFAAHADEQVALGAGRERILRAFGCSVYQQTQLSALIRRLFFGYDLVLRFQQALKTALLVLRCGIVLIGSRRCAAARRIQKRKQQVKTGVLHQLEVCRTGGITESELESARKTLVNSWRTMLDDPLTLERYWLGQAAAGTLVSPEARIDQMADVDLTRVITAAQNTALDTVFFMKGAAQ